MLGPDDFKDGRGNDCRNYGVPDGLPEVRALFGELLDLPTDGVVLGDNSSLSLMADALGAAVSHGVPGGSGPWRDAGAQLLCPVSWLRPPLWPDQPPGRRDDKRRHWRRRSRHRVGRTPRRIGRANQRHLLVPKYQNPVGYTLTPEEVHALATMKTAAPDFRILWDNAYVVHHIDEVLDPVANVLQACEEAGNPDRAWVFGSTSKVTFAGAGVSAFGGSAANVAWFRKHRGVRTIGPDKINQLRHLRFFGDADGVRSHMKRHASLLRPQFEVVQRVLETHLGGATSPTGRSREAGTSSAWTRAQGVPAACSTPRPEPEWR